MTVINSRNFSVIDGYDSSSGYISRAINVGSGYSFSMTAAFTGSPSGSAYLEASNDWGESGFAPTTWVLVNQPEDTTVSIAGAGKVIWAIARLPYKWIRLVYMGSGASSLSVRGNVKG